MNIISHQATFLAKEISLETGRFATLSDGAVMLTYGDNTIFASAMMSDSAREGMNFFPLLIEYQEKFYANGKIKNSKVNKREARPAESEILKGRLIDRTLRPLFPATMRNEVQVVINILSTDGTTDLSDLAITAASAAIMQAGIPFAGPAAGIKIGMSGTDLVVHPDYTVDEQQNLEFMVSGKEGSILMVEAVANEVSEDKMIEALGVAQKNIEELLQLQREFLTKVTVKPTREIYYDLIPDELQVAVDEVLTEEVLGQLFVNTKSELNEAESKIKQFVFTELEAQMIDQEWSKGQVGDAIFKNFKRFIRKNIIAGKRLDGRDLDQIRPLEVEVGVLPRVHGTGHFRRGDTESLTIVTLGGPSSELYVEEIDKDYRKRYFHHYNMPGYSTADVKMNRGASRREIGHGHLGERALQAVLPSTEDFPYTIRVVSELMTSNGSTSMAATCGSTLALMDAGVPIRKPVSGIAMGLVSDGKTYQILSDIQGMEDFIGDMDFKVAGTADGITALQMDIKLTNISLEIMGKALKQALQARLFILDKMVAVLAEPRKELSPYAPMIFTMMVKPEQIGAVIGSGGKNIKNITETSGCEISISDDDSGAVFITAPDQAMGDVARKMIEEIVFEPSLGDVLDGTVVKILDFGAVVALSPTLEGLLHISELDNKRVEKVEDVVKQGDKLQVKIIRVENNNGRLKVSLSRKALIK